MSDAELADLGATLAATETGDAPVRFAAAVVSPAELAAAVDHALDELAAGAEIIVQPSANFAPWTRRWPPDETYSEGEAWLSFGLRRGVRGRQHIRYGVNPMLVGGLLDLRAEGRSSVVANPRFRDAETEGYGGIVMMARSYDQEEIIRTTVTLPG